MSCVEGQDSLQIVTRIAVLNRLFAEAQLEEEKGVGGWAGG